MVLGMLLWIGLEGRGRSQPGDPEYRSYNGRGNNVERPELGMAGIQLRRLTPVAYGDGISAPSGADRPSARAISNAVCAQPDLSSNTAGATDLFWLWGQFIDHDMDLTKGGDPAESLPIAVPAADRHFDPLGTGTQQIPFTRSTYNPLTGTNPGNPRQQINKITAFIDASNVYGADQVVSTALRRLDGRGRMKTSRGRLLPFNKAGLPNVGGTGRELFLAGDVRANEHVALTALHTIFVREHNRLTRLLTRRNRKMPGYEAYERARAIVGAELQVITYGEFLPVLLGPGALAPYAGYDPSVDPSIANVFSTVAFRFGHSMLSGELALARRDGRPTKRGGLGLRDAFFDPRLLERDVRMSSLFRGLAGHVAQQVDPFVIDDVRNFLFGPPGAGGLDLAALNIQRGRDHGLPDYNGVRIAFGLEPAAGFADITSNLDLQQRLASVYADVGQVDPWVGGLAEDHVPGALVGELFFTIIKDQFERLRDGDRFWYARTFSPQEVAELERTTLGDIIRRNTSVNAEMGDFVLVRE
jgi:peroxidase